VTILQQNLDGLLVDRLPFVVMQFKLMNQGAKL